MSLVVRLRRHLPPVLGVALALALIAGPAHAGKRDAPDVIDDALAYALTDRAKAIALLEEALAKSPDGPSAAWIAVHAAEHKRLQGDRPGARELFKRAQELGAGTDAEVAGRVGVALVRAANEIDAANLRTLETLSEKGVLDTQNADRFLVLAIDAHGRGDSSRASQYGKKALGYAKGDPAVKARISRALDDLERGQTAISPQADLGKLDRAREALAAGDAPRAAQLAREAEAEAAEGSEERLAASYLVKRAEANRPVDPNTIAVLLPLSGKYEAAGRQVREALEYGYKAGGGAKRLVFLDTLATPEGAVGALEQAVLRDGAVAVVGPLLSDATDPVVRAATALEVPLVSLSQSFEEDGRPWVWQGVPSIGDQVDALVAHAVRQESMQRFAIFAPDTTYGRRAAEAFRAAAAANSATVTVEVFYDPEATALMDFAKQLGRKDYEARKAELWKLRREAEASGGNPNSVVLPPEIDFDAIFLPDNARKIPIACAALAYEEFPIGDFKPRRTDTAVPLLGLSGWNAADLVGAGGEYTRSSRFTDAFYVDDAPEFVDAYKGTLGRTPSSLEAVTVDAGRLIALATREPSADRASFQQALGKVTASGTPTGATRFDPARHRVVGTVRILTIDRDGIKPLASPEAP